jgi:hypothetical protein
MEDRQRGRCSEVGVERYPVGTTARLMTLPAALLHWRHGGMMRRESARHYMVGTASSCDYPFRVGVRYRIESEALATSDGRVVWASQCGATRTIWTWELRALSTMLEWWWLGGCRN